MNDQDLPSAVDDAATAAAESAANSDQEITDPEEELKRKIELLRKRDPFVYR